MYNIDISQFLLSIINIATFDERINEIDKN